MRKVLFLSPLDNIAVCLSDIAAGEMISQEGREVTAIEHIPRGHKISIRGILKSEGVIKYGERMGHATTDIPVGAHVHTHNVLGDRLSTEQV
ncbi:MAG: UxaA family hydrolase [Actinomycetota bacterium]